MPEPEAAGAAPTSAIRVTSTSRATKRALGPTAWAVLEDVALDAQLRAGRWEATTSVRLVALHLGLTPGTVARALARLCSEGLVHREDRRDDRTGRFGESVYVIGSSPAVVPCIDEPHTEERDAALGADASRAFATDTTRPYANTARPNPETPTTPNPQPTKTQHPNATTTYTQNPSPMNQRASNTCQPSGQALPGRAPC